MNPEHFLNFDRFLPKPKVETVKKRKKGGAAATGGAPATGGFGRGGFGGRRGGFGGSRGGFGGRGGNRGGRRF